MNILVVHDREEVLQKICVMIRELLGEETKLETATSAHLAREKLRKTIFDLLIIDLTLPFDKESNPTYDQADNLLSEVFNLGTLKIPGDIIGITADLDALEKIKTKLGPHLMVIIEEDDEGEWEGYLKDKIRYAQNASLTRLVSINQHYDYDVLIITALDEEMAPFEDQFETSEVDYFPNAKKFIFYDKDKNIRRGITFSIGRSGQPSSASYTQSLISTFRPKLALMSGICGGVIDKVKLGDLIFFETSYAWDYGKWKEIKDIDGQKKTKFVSRPNPIGIVDSKSHKIARKILLSDFRNKLLNMSDVKKLKSDNNILVELHLCDVGSGSAVVANNEIISKITNLNDSIWAVDMESYGFYHAAKHTNVIKPEFICIKSVSDYCSSKKNDDLHKLCSLISSKAIEVIIKEYWEFGQ
ncbi:MAG: hypothetical protein H6912_03215 [Kordiimonadaceae bacterium]|nr:hypothetical protein [Kordiimonadaceae bacterium]